MKVNPTNPGVSARKPRAKTNAASTSFSALTPNSEQAVTKVMTSSPIASVDALIALQAEEVETASQQATKRAGSLLNVLDTIKLGLLEGGIEKQTLKRLLRALGEQRQDTGDPALEAILQQVEIRAHVELAKMQVMEK